MAAPIVPYTRTPPPADPESSALHLDSNLTSLERTTASLIAASATKAPLDSPALTGAPTAPTAATGDSSTLLATTGFVKAQGYVTAAASPVTSVAGKTGAVTLAVADVSGAAPLASPALTGTPTVPTATAGTNTTQAASTGFVAAAVTGLAPLASPALTGTPTAPTPTAGDNSTKVATTAFVAALAGWISVKKTADQTFTSATLVNVTDLAFPIAANSTIAFRIAVSCTDAGVTGSFGLSGPASPSRLRFGNWGNGQTTAYGTTNVGPSVAVNLHQVAGLIVNGPNAGTVNFQCSVGAGGTIVIEKGSLLEYMVLS